MDNKAGTCGGLSLPSSWQHVGIGGQLDPSREQAGRVRGGHTGVVTLGWIGELAGLPIGIAFIVCLIAALWGIIRLLSKHIIDPIVRAVQLSMETLELTVSNHLSTDQAERHMFTITMSESAKTMQKLVHEVEHLVECIEKQRREQGNS